MRQLSEDNIVFILNLIFGLVIAFDFSVVLKVTGNCT